MCGFNCVYHEFKLGAVNRLHFFESRLIATLLFVLNVP